MGTRDRQPREPSRCARGRTSPRYGHNRNAEPQPEIVAELLKDHLALVESAGRWMTWCAELPIEFVSARMWARQCFASGVSCAIQVSPNMMCISASISSAVPVFFIASTRGSNAANLVFHLGRRVECNSRPQQVGPACGEA